MREFVFGTEEQFAELDSLLNDHRCHIYSDCVLPGSCRPQKARLGFEKTAEGYYIMYIDRGICTDCTNQDFKDFLENGETKFTCLEDMTAFLGSLRPLFGSLEAAGEAVRQAGIPEASSATETEKVYNRERVQELREEAQEQKIVWPEEIAEPLKKKIYGQDMAIDEIASKISKSCLKKGKKLLVIALLGPTATGKTETAKSLAEILTSVTGRQYGFIKVAANEYLEEHTVSRFFGAPPGYVGYGNKTVLEPVRQNPYHVIVIDEIEKGHAKLITGLMEAIDTGYLGMADNSDPIDLNQCIMLFTSNIPVDMKQYQAMSRFERPELCRDTFTKHCKRPEISGKIGNFVVFQPLTDEATLDIAAKFIREELLDYDLRLTHIDERLMVDFLKYQTKYGARAIRELVSDSLGEQLLYKRQLESLKDKSVFLKGTIENIEFEIA
ncbi:MAG: AAA family ATPase [Lachnospiraceae bacterium]|nr:AAA family ATPase [Lachnospiraceae bacterium]